MSQPLANYMLDIITRSTAQEADVPWWGWVGISLAILILMVGLIQKKSE